MTRPRIRVLGAFVLAVATIVGTALRADGLIGGAPLQYNHVYRCNGERLFVVHCRDDSDAAGCAVEYPDRPERNGMMVQTVEDRGDVIRKLQACAASTAAAAPAAAPTVSAVVKPPPDAAADQPPTAIAIGPAMCPLLRRLEGLAREDFRSIDLGPNPGSADNPAQDHRTRMPIPGADCGIEHLPGEPILYSCLWPRSNDVEDQFYSMVKTLEECTGGSADLSNLTEYSDADVKVTARGVEYRTMITNDFLSLDVHEIRPGLQP
jgi:hypothetical protein